MPELRIDPDDPVSPSQQLVAALLDGIASGAWCVGDRLPTVRGLAQAAAVNANTVKKCYRDLSLLGVLRTRNGDGAFVTPVGPEIAQAVRMAETLAEVRRALGHAVRAGIDPTVLQQEVAAAARAVVPDAGLAARP